MPHMCQAKSIMIHEDRSCNISKVYITGNVYKLLYGKVMPLMCQTRSFMIHEDRSVNISKIYRSGNVHKLF